MPYNDWVSILLSVVTIVLAAVGLAVAALAIWGYGEFMKKAAEKADDVATKIATAKVEAYLKEDRFERLVKDSIQRLIQEKAISRTTVDGEQNRQEADDVGGSENIPPLPQ